jgi:hypothetical protein
MCRETNTPLFGKTIPPFEELNEHSIRIRREDRSNRSDGLRFLRQKSDAALPQSRRGRLDTGDTKRQVINPHMVRCRISLARGRRVPLLHQVDEHAAGLGWSEIRHRESACPQLKAPCNSVFIDLAKTLDDLESQCFIESNASFQVPARDADMQKVINYCCHRCE